jgi:indole-3-glycerol phosphate synthase
LPETQEERSLPGILAEIVDTKRQELAALAHRAATLEDAAARAAAPRGFTDALARPGFVSLIAECKRRSPGAGSIRPDLDPAELTAGYERAGASALSVLTDATYFGGSINDLAAVRAATSIPILRKDFTLDRLHLLEARAGGADAVLLIVRILDDAELRRLHRDAIDLGLDVLVEVHDAAELERALRIDARLIGINNRDLATFTTDLATSERLLESVPPEVVIVSESGIRSREDVQRLGRAGVDAILVGESILSVADPSRAAGELATVPNVRRSRRG